ncbi:hypothetical protein [Nonomuraea sp. KM90]|uniref:hypothetical protein n=1 Tax=Nonomuraea sp. KM90 TaxID=3457428 RepID=UPI003FCDC596
METFEDFMARIGPDPAVTGVVLSGSQAREGTATAHARAAGHGDVLDSWGEDLAFMRGA